MVHDLGTAVLVHVAVEEHGLIHLLLKGEAVEALGLILPIGDVMHMMCTVGEIQLLQGDEDVQHFDAYDDVRKL